MTRAVTVLALATPPGGCSATGRGTVAFRIRIRFGLKRKRQAQGVAPRRELDRRRSHSGGLSIINDVNATAGDRLRAMEQLESRALGKPKETVEQVYEEPEFMKDLRALTPEERRQLLRQWTDEAAEQGGEAGG
jgi:hypothetical protein